MNTCLTMFSGGGLADVGLKAAGYTPVGAVEWDAAIAEVYALNHGAGHLKIAAVEAVDYHPYAGVTLAWVSPCCTNASIANTDGKESEADLSAAAAICRMLREARPQRFVLENVYQYRQFQSFQLILRTLQELGYAFAYEHVNFADYGVPQTRKRLILRAVLGARYVPPLYPTHCEGGDAGGLFAEEELLPWVGWYAAIEDLIPTLPESQFADWQLARLHDTPMGDWMVGGGNTNKEMVSSRPSLGRLPSFTVTGSSDRDRAFLVDGQNATVDGKPIVRAGEPPALTVFGSAVKGMPRALLVGDQERQYAAPEDPSFTVRAGTNGGALPKALLVNGDNASRDPTTRDGEAPSFAVGDGSKHPFRAWLEQGRVVGMTPRALARFQSVPDAYQITGNKKLDCKVIGNAVPPEGTQHIAKSFER